jgi:hypothetical protein
MNTFLSAVIPIFVPSGSSGGCYGPLSPEEKIWIGVGILVIFATVLGILVYHIIQRILENKRGEYQHHYDYEDVVLNVVTGVLISVFGVAVIGLIRVGIGFLF